MEATAELAWAEERLIHRAVVLYDEGSEITHRMATALARGIRGEGVEVDVVGVQSAGPEVPENYDLLVVGSPSEHLTATSAIRHFLGRIKPSQMTGRYAFAYDTRQPFHPAGAARRIEARLVHLGATAVLPPFTTIVPNPPAGSSGAPPTGAEGPRPVGEEEFEEVGRTLVRSIRHELKERW